MKIELKEITVRDLVEGYIDKGDEGVTGYSGKLDIRPPFQREFVYGDKERNAVIDTVMRGYPLNVMYWAVRGDDYEIIDGQQRTISLAQYVNGDFSFNMRYFHSLESDEANKFLDYPLMVYVCDGTDSEKLKWFETINIAGKELTKQELRNAVYSGSWVTAAKKDFSARNCRAYKIGNRYLSGEYRRQKYLETAIQWITGESSDQAIRQYMSIHQHERNANDLWRHFRSVIDQAEALFPNYRKEMKNVDWGGLYEHMRNDSLDPEELNCQMLCRECNRRKGAK